MQDYTYEPKLVEKAERSGWYTFATVMMVIGGLGVLITLFIACAFLLALVLCSGAALKEAGITLASLSSVQIPGISASPDPSGPPVQVPGTDMPSDAPEYTPAGTDFPGTDILSDPEYNVFGL